MGTAKYGWRGFRAIKLLLACIVCACVGARAQGAPGGQSTPVAENPQTQAPPQQPPQEDKQQEDKQQEDKQEDKKKEESTNPGQYAAEKTMQAAVATEKVGKAALFKARDWESGWLTGVYLGRDQPMVPLTRVGRQAIYLDQTLATPGAYMKRMFAAGIDQARGSPPQWGGGIGGYGIRFASREGQFISANTLAYLGNSALRYEPRYDQCRCSGWWPRARHAILRNFVTYNQSERELRPQLGLYAGSFGGGLISTAWKPEPRNAFAEGGRAMLGQAGYGTLLNIFIEFSGDLNRAMGARKKRK